VFNYCALLGLS